MNKPAFPRPYSNDDSSNSNDSYYDDQEGMSLLEYYAGQALITQTGKAVDSVKNMVNQSFDIAEAMVKEAEKRNLVS